jgi:hypothetical protein
MRVADGRPKQRRMTTRAGMHVILYELRPGGAVEERSVLQPQSHGARFPWHEPAGRLGHFRGGGSEGTACAGMNRHVVGDARAPQERSSDSILTSSLAWAFARRLAKRRRRLDGLGD